MSELENTLGRPFSSRESLRDLRKFRNVKWIDDTPVMLSSPEINNAAWVNRGVTQMRRRSWPSLQERCSICNDMFFPFARHMKNPVDIWTQGGVPERADPLNRLEEYLDTIKESPAQVRRNNMPLSQPLFPLNAVYETSTHISKISCSARLGCPTCKLLIEALINYDRREPLAWQTWDCEACIHETKTWTGLREDDSPDPTTICHLRFREGLDFMVTDGKHDYSIAWGKKLLGTRGAKTIHLHTGLGEWAYHNPLQLWVR